MRLFYINKFKELSGTLFLFDNNVWLFSHNIKRFSMKNAIKLQAIQRIAGIIAIVAVITIGFVTCDNGSGGDSSGPGHTPAWKEIAPSMVSIPGGSVYMENAENSFDNYTATLSSYRMSKYQVTQAQYESVMKYNPSFYQGALRPPSTGEVQEKRPVEQVSWYDAILFCNLLSLLEGLTPAYSVKRGGTEIDWATTVTPKDFDADWDAATINAGSNGYRLPTEAQWEYAARAGSTGDFSIGVGGTEVTELNLFDYAWFYGNNAIKTHEVGKKLPNAYGIYDMHGNVYEWCWDWYDYYPASAQTDYTGPSTDYGMNRVSRGGAYFDTSEQLVSSFRSSIEMPPNRTEYRGFRLACP